MYRFLLTRQWVCLTLIGLVLVPAMIELGFWQFHRHERRVEQNALIARNLDAKPVPVTELTSPGHRVPRSDYWRGVVATGTFDTAGEVVVRRRTDSDERVGYHVLTPLVLGDGRVVMVNRGWVPSATDPTAFPEVPAPPRGEITVTGRLKADETTKASGIKDLAGLPPRQVMLINSEQQAKLLGREVLGGYLELTGPEPAGNLPKPVHSPDHDSIGAHMAYAIQWWLFTTAVPIGWVILVRRELRDRREAASKEAAGAARAAEPAGSTDAGATGAAGAAGTEEPKEPATA
ncbi:MULTISPECIES: SURF1 family cytochrome oxidase biogenesis protein [Streptomyces]|uniref:SURF1-like protein n=1 Tax=Streptomyces tsukubensis (strain DSM 42081 / NBRC 108919 / NRRL 18488 / 9993) TaxID=1114943 RepID=I2MW64_STRT9|nr:SURF1 family protein [Streptomyces tsukubensis]MYS64013.1 SURF1 family protein [Streptomyces sp. SID5473]AZK93452.1 hypothetical protein B7R87_05865 [Streptomyces tsukubensis]EIF89011.1 hypothetical protein [Streptomyces tsukubensis NRRL18488]QKM70393.1 SURF1 family protein [Streptomyces tsukubensis NRRL18488]TAI45621.1 SURF1 family protein [Streptomyces tsukubensis]